MYRELDLAEIQIEAERMGYVVIPIEEYERLEKAIDLACKILVEYNSACPFEHYLCLHEEKGPFPCIKEQNWDYKKCWREYLLEAQES